MGVIGSSSEYSRPASNVAENDLRLKLLRKRLSKQIELDAKKRELEGKISRNVHSSEAPKGFRLVNNSQMKRAGESSRMESVQTSYSSSTIDGSRPITPNGVPQISGGMLSSRPMGQVLGSLPTMQVLSSRNGVFQHPHSKGPTPMTVMAANSRAGLDPHKSLMPARSNIAKTTYMDEHLTVSALLNSLGLGKYSIILQAEEVDMAALKQMGDRDLKEIGIPMGPRKKILLALLAQSKRRTT
ncbi:OLC1v1011227C2 [Oldenlandia corymbosa var. corymbosa]|nr:OLC1v1011227C2 [Oldenlandia corymbosa var. corymbosa]